MCCGSFLSLVETFFSFVMCYSLVKHNPQDYINEFIIRKLNPLVVVDFRFISAFLHALWAVKSHAGQLWNFYQLILPEFDGNVFYEI